MNAPNTPSRPRGGFTLLELLVVIAIIGLLVVAFAPALTGALGQGDVTVTKGRAIELAAMADAYMRYYGDYPPDDMSVVAKDKQKGWNLGNDNGKNTGIESLVMHLSWDAKAGGKLDEKTDWLANTDGDRAPVDIPMLGTREKYEVVDAWGTPFAYFSARTGSQYQGRQTIVGRALAGAEATESIAQPWKNAETGAFLSPRKFQIISAGPDLEFNTPDDVVFPEKD